MAEASQDDDRPIIEFASQEYSWRRLLKDLNGKYTETEVLLCSSENRNDVTMAFSQLEVIFGSLKLKFEEYYKGLAGQQAEKVLKQYLSSCKEKMEFDERVKEYFRDAYTRAESPDKTDRSEVMSIVSRISVDSQRSHKTKVALAKRKREQLEKVQKIEMERFRLEQKLKSMELEMEIENAEVELDIVGGSDEESVTTWPMAPPMNEHVSRKSYMPEFDHTSNAPVYIPPVSSELASIFQAVTMATTMPKPELATFSGRPIDYWNFINSFEVNIANKISDDRAKLTYLIQHCTGKAKVSIENCVLMDARKGYCEARRILSEQFGQPYIVARAHMQNVVNRQPLKPNDGEALWDLARDMRRCLITLQEIRFVADMNSTDNLLSIQRLLPIHLQSKWARKAQSSMDKNIPPDFSQMTQFVEECAKLANNMYGRNVGKSTKVPNTASQSKDKTSRPPYKVTTLSTQLDNSKPDVRTCVCCNREHKLETCTEFKQRPYKDRLRLVRDNRLCDNCFEPWHIARGCMRRSQCGKENCRKKHHQLLHSTEANAQERWKADVKQDQKTVKPDQLPPKERSVQCHSTLATSKVCLRVVPVKVLGNGREVSTWALLDDGSDVSLCDKRLVDDLGIDGKVREFKLTTANSVKNVTGKEVNVTVCGISTNECVNLSRVLTIENLRISNTCIPSKSDVKKWKHLQDIDLPDIKERDVRLLIGGDTPEAFWVIDERRGECKEPYAIKSVLGWTVMGPLGPEMITQCFNVNFIGSSSDEHLYHQLTKFWETDFGDYLVEGNVGDSVEDGRARKQMEATVKLVDSHYEIGLPWRNEHPYLPNNRSMAEKRLHHLKGRLQRDPDLYAKYTSVMSDYITKGYAERVPEEDQSDPSWYLPHHPVIHPHKPGKLRVVFDCAARYGSTSLNDQLLRGPDYTNSLVGVLTRFRHDPIAITADIEAMFHQVKVKPRDRGALKFLWWNNGEFTKAPSEYQMSVHLFGATSSPSCAGFALRRTAESNRDDFDEEVIESVMNNFYVDDFLKSVRKKGDACKLINDLRSLLQRGGFNLTKWISNDVEVLSAIPKEERTKSVIDLNFDGLPTERTLGVLWNVESDTFDFKVKIREKPATRRGILSTASSIYDPLGFLAPAILPAKILLQKLCKRGVDWDDPIEACELEQWRLWLDDLHKLEKIKIGRCLKPNGFRRTRTMELHTFCDASEVGYAAVTYLRLVNAAEVVNCSFVMGKSRLCPLKVVSIPRLELSAAVLAVKLSRLVEEELKLPIECKYYWTDSTSVLQYIRNESRRFHTFVANRVAKIREASEPQQWRYVTSAINPSDDGSRGMKVEELIANPRWIKGPEFLLGDEDCWPQQVDLNQELSIDDPEVKRNVQVNINHVTTGITELLKRYSSWTKLRKGVAWLLRFKSWLQHKTRGRVLENTSELLSAGELKEAETEIVMFVQRQEFPEFVTGNGKDKSIVKLNPIMVDGVMRVGGRLSNAPIDNDAKHPVILPSNHHITRLLIEYHHKIVGHSGSGITWTSLREKYWVLKGGAAVRKTIGMCFACKRRNALPGRQIMAELPAVRVTPDCPAFTNVGVDYFGPLIIKQGRSHLKRYGCIFTCLNIRAVHIELSNTLDTDSFINALRRFISRRGKPAKILSDNGTNFRGAERELKENLRVLDQRKVGDFLHGNGIEWSFNPPAASHMGGVWERMIRSVRRILKTLIGGQVVCEEVLATMLTEVEAILNSRPLTRLSLDPNDDEPLTPNHILLMKKCSSFPPGVFTNDDSYGRRRWRQVQYLASVFWKRWRREYLPLLQERQKWTKPHRNIAVDDLVLVVDDNAPRGKWSLGRVVEVFEGKDKKVRQADVKIGSKVLKRPIVKLCLVEASTEVDHVET